jgi:hypothetical protein
LWAVHDSFLGPELAFCTDEAWIHLSGYINAQNNQYWSSINPKQSWSVLLLSEYWCVVCHDCYMYNSTHVSFQTLLIQSGISVLFFGPFLRARQSIQGIPSHWMNLSKAFMKHIYWGQWTEINASLFKRLDVCLEQKGDVLSVYCNGEFFKQQFLPEMHTHVYNV